MFTLYHFNFVCFVTCVRNLLDPAIDLVFSDLRARSQVMSRMIAFMTTKCDKFNE